MKKKLSIIITTAFVAVLTLSAGAFAYGGGKTGQHMGKGGMTVDRQAPESRYESMWNALSTEQQDQLKALQQNFIDESASIRTELTAKKANMSILLDTSSPDATELKNLAGEIADLEAKIMEKRIDFMLNAKKVVPDFRFGPNAGFGGMQHGNAGGMNYHGSMYRGGSERGPGAGCWR